MPSIEFSTSFINEPDLILTPQQVRNIYLYGIDNILDSQSKSFSDSDISFYIQAAQGEVENSLNIKLKKQVYTENLQFNNNEWMQWGYMRVTKPIRCPMLLEGYLNTIKQVSYPKEWLTTKKSSDEKDYQRNLFIVPVGGATMQTQNAVYSGVMPQLGYLGQRHIPYYWTVEYVTGFDQVPSEIVDVVGKLASINLFNVAADLILGTPGIGSKSISIDGLSQSLNSASGFDKRIKNYTDSLVKSYNALIAVYKGLTFGSI